jgi:RND family efflux transporter MFP subunit
MKMIDIAPPALRPEIKRRARRRPNVPAIVAGLALAVGLGGWTWTRTHPGDDLASELLTAPVTRGDLIETVSATGSVTAQTGAQVKIGSQITGRIKQLYTDVGSHVKAGQVIAELDLPDIHAQLGQAMANLAAARTKLFQQTTGVSMERTQTGSAVEQAEEAVRSAQAKLAAASAAARLQSAQTPTDIKRAKASLAAAQAALSTAKSNLAQVQASANLQIATAQEQLKQAEAMAHNSTLNLKRQQELLQKGFVAASLVDDAQAAAAVDQSKVESARQNIELVKAKVSADLQAARDQTVQAQQNAGAAQAALAAAQAGTYQDTAKLADVNDAGAQVRQAAANLRTALANTTNNVLKLQDVQQAREAVHLAQAQVDYAKAQVQKTYIRTPISGTVLQLAAQQGETLAAGLSAPTLIVVADLERLQVDAFVDETDIGKVRVGQKTDVTVDAFPRHHFKGRVTKIAAGSTIQQGVVTYEVTVAIRDRKHRLRPDMTASTTIDTGRRSNVLMVPSEAVKLGVHGTTVNVVTRQYGRTRVERRRVKTGGTDGVDTEIRQGLHEGETVVLAGLDEGKKRSHSASPLGPTDRAKL